jgi:tRNA (guanine37-N1)-methyltransferase
MMEAAARLVEGVLGDPQSAADDSMSDGLLEYPQYTRPREFRGEAVPEVLLGGNHAEIDKWRRSQSIERTALRRPDLVEKAPLSDAERRNLTGGEQKN